MKLPDKINPVHCASKDGSRHVLNSVSLQGNLAVATDGRCLFAALGERGPDDDARDALLPKRAAKAAWPQAKKSRGVLLPMLTILPAVAPAAATCSLMTREMDTIQIRDIDGKFPAIDRVIPAAAGYTQRVGLNIAFLANIAKSFGETEVFIHFDAAAWLDGQQGQPMLVTSKTQEAFAVLMPARCSYDLRDNKALAAVTARVKAKQAAEDAAREASIAAAQALIDAERAAAAAQAEADKEKTADWLAEN